ncbi:DNA polymerase II large subunit [Candidatus Woesearchaeota archaeon]|nr:DNA polymerase II large subunit [Candidatus Woesearchaeota archaeon]
MTTIQEYFDALEKETLEAYKLASKARAKGYDPDTKPEVVLAKNLAERVIGLISVAAPQLRESGAIKRIETLEKEHGVLDWRVAFQIAHEVAQEKFCKFPDKREAMEVGIRTGFAYVTLGAVSAPLEGFTKLELKPRRDGTGDFFCLNFSGPIRAAGGTAAAVCVLIADYVRNKCGYVQYDPDEKEVRRCHAEITDYHEWVTNLQYFPSKEEMDFMVAHMPVEISGDPSEKYEISNVTLKDLPRIPTNRMRSGYCLMYSSALPLKAPKVWAKLGKWADKFEMTHWNWLDEFLKIQKTMKAKDGGKKKDDKKSDLKIKPDFTYIADLVAGRPVFGYPLRSGGFRLRYGRSRLSGYSAQSINPATMIILNEFIAIATQLKVERPGKAGAYTSCDTIEGPVVRLKNGSVLRIDTEKEAKELKNDVSEILYLGDVLINYGDFFDRAHPLVPAGYVQEEWILEFERAALRLFGTFDLEKISDLVDIDPEKLDVLFKKPFTTKISLEAAKHISQALQIPLHPSHIFFWNSITQKDVIDLASWIFEKGKIIPEKEAYPDSQDDAQCLAIQGSDAKRSLELIGAPHVFKDQTVLIKKDPALALLANLGARTPEELETKISLLRADVAAGNAKNPLELVNKVSGVEIRDRCGTFIGARMGRPEKAKMRKLTSSPHVLFPVGNEGGKYRSFQSALEKGFVSAQFTPFYCKYCKRETVFPTCEICDKPAEKMSYCKKQDKLVKFGTDCEGCREKMNPDGEPCHPQLYKIMKFNMKESFPALLKRIDTNIYPDLIKGVKGTSNKEHTAEHLVKGILRAKHSVCVNKDGTVRYDCSEIPITHFKPKEIGATVKKLIELGYEEDIHNKPLVSDEQILEIKPQDILLPCSPVSPEEPADEVMFRVANFTDELLEKFYGQKPYYKLKTKEDLIGHLVIGLAPHTSAGILCRILGFSKTQGFLSHPYIHAAMRRDCDGDESCFLLLMDGLLNFSKKYLPESRGSTMDAPLVLTYILNPAEVDDMIFNMDIAWKYDLPFYEAAKNYKPPWEVKIKQVSHVLNTPLQYERMGFTHDTSDMNQGVLCSAYKLLPSMEDKLRSQMELAEKIRAVDSSDVAKLVIDKHFMKDTKGNLRKFSQQEFRCIDCNEKYRRPPLSGKCTACGGRLIFTVSEGFVIKYLNLSMQLAEKYGVPNYLKQSLELLKQRVESVFGKDKDRQEGLSAWLAG